jgi:hypothetical protein
LAYSTRRDGDANHERTRLEVVPSPAELKNQAASYLKGSMGTHGADSLSASTEAFERDEVDGRTGRQWLESMMTYCDFLSGKAWRNLADPQHRHDPERVLWVQVRALLKDVMYRPDEADKLHMLAPVLNPAPAPLAGEVEFRDWRRDSLAMALVTENPQYTDAKLLRGLPKNKLAHMLAETRLDARNSARATA